MYLQSIQWYQAKSISDSVGFTSLLTVRMGASSHSWSASSTSTFITHCWSQPSLQKSNFTESTLHRASFNWQRQKVKPHYFDVGVKRNIYERLDHYGNEKSILDGNNQLARKCGSDWTSLMLIWEIIPVTLKNNTQRTKNTPSRLGEYLNNSKAFNRAKERCLAGWALFRGNLYSSGKYFRFFRSWCFAASESWHLFSIPIKFHCWSTENNAHYVGDLARRKCPKFKERIQIKFPIKPIFYEYLYTQSFTFRLVIRRWTTVDSQPHGSGWFHVHYARPPPPPACVRML